MLNLQRIYDLAGIGRQKLSFLIRNSNRSTGSSDRTLGRFEILERRDLLTGFIEFNPTSGFITIQGSAENDVAQVAYAPNSQIEVSLTDVQSELFDVGSVNGIIFRGEAGNDRFSNLTAIDSDAYGGTGSDRLSGGSGSDFLNGQSGFDRLFGGDGIDRMFGGFGADYMHGGSQNDEMYGGAGDDVIAGAPGSDRIFGEDGLDRIFGYFGNDRINGGNGNDEIYGNDGDDRLFGENGDDMLDGGSGDDYLHGGDQDDIIIGGSGNDFATGAYGDDSIYGDAGADLIYGYFGVDRIEGGDGADMLYGNEGDDTIYGDAGQDDLHGGDGNDALFGGELGSADTLYGEAGADRMLVQSSDSILDLTAADAELVFVNQTSNWTDAEIQIMDRGFALLHERTQNTVLLQDSLGTDPLTFYKYSYLNGAAGINSLAWSSWTECDSSGCETVYDFDREIRIVDWDETNAWNNNQFVQVVIHEIGHNWDSDWEITEASSSLVGLWDQFTSYSDWRDTNPGGGYTQSLDGQWWYHSSASFAENYGRSNPHEDFSTVFEYYFGNGANSGDQGLQLKLDALDLLFETLS